MKFPFWGSADTKEKLDKLANDVIEQAAETYQPELKDKVSKCKKKAIIEKSWKAVKTYMDDVSPMWKNQTPVGGGEALTLETLQKVANSINSQANEALNIPTKSLGGSVQLTAEQMKSAGNKPGGSGLKALYDQEIQNLKEDVQTLSFKGKPFIANTYSTTTTPTNTNTGNIYWTPTAIEGYTTTFPDVGFTEPPSPKQPQTMEELYKGTSFDIDSPNYQKVIHHTKYGDFKGGYAPGTPSDPNMKFTGGIANPTECDTYTYKWKGVDVTKEEYSKKCNETYGETYKAILQPGSDIKPNKLGVIKSLKEDNE